MKRWILLGSCSFGVVPALLALTTGCSSDNAGGSVTTDGGTDGSVADAEPTVDGSGAPCAPNAHEVVAAKIVLDVNWPTTLANAGCLHSKGCDGQINIWLLAKYDFDMATNKITGTTATCRNETPPIPLTALGTESEGLDPSQTTAKVQITFDDATWAKIAMNAPPTQTTGSIGGWNVGSSFKIDPTTSTYGLKPSSPLYGPSATWPASESLIPMSDLSDDDGDGPLGITAIPSSMGGNSLPATALTTSPPFAPKADQLSLVLRTELSLYGTSKSCTEVDGTAQALLLNNHVVGCRLENNGGACTMTQWDFIDTNSTVYLGPGVKVPAGTNPASFAPPQIYGTFQSKILSTDADGGGMDNCAAVLAALP